MIQTTSPLCSLNSIPQPLSSLPLFPRSIWPVRRLPNTSETPSSAVRLSLHNLRSFPLVLSSSCRVATHEIVETTEVQSGFVEVGYISGAHGIAGEIRVKPSTGFPELRFSEPGKRWLKQETLGRESIREVELMEGRGHPGQKSWILKFQGIETAEEAKLLTGSKLLVREEDRPELEEGDFYTRDLLGMRVILKETEELLGTVTNVYNSGGNDLLKVMVNHSKDAGVSGRTVWIPFVEAIVPDVDVIRREMHITPPKGLLELNLRADERSKKERRQLEWKERKKFQKRLIAAKKKLCEMEQQHVFHGFKFGEKSHVKLLSEEILSIDSKLLQRALQDIEMPSKRWTMTELSNAIECETLKNSLKISEECFVSNGKKETQNDIVSCKEEGLRLTSDRKTAIVLVVNEEGWEDISDIAKCGSTKNPSSLLQTLLDDAQRFAHIEHRQFVPLILVCSASRISSIQKLFLDNDYFAFDSKKVWFLEEEKLPVVGHLVEEQKWRKILMKSPWEILQSPVGSGGVMNLLLSHNLIDDIGEMGIDYVEVCSSSQKYPGMNSLLLGFLNSCKADVGIQLFKNTNNDESFDMIFSIQFLKKLAKQMNKLKFYATPKSNSHVEMVDKEWINVEPSTANSNELRCSILSSLNVCSMDKVCAIKIGE